VPASLCLPERKRSSISRGSARRRSSFFAGSCRFRDGTPSHDHLGDIFATLDATEFQRRFVAWVAKLIGVSADVIAIDGKDVARLLPQERRKSGDPHAVRFRGAPAPRTRPKSKWRTNPMRSSPSLRFSICWRSTAPSSPIDAMGLPARQIAQKVLDKKADYILALKRQPGHAARGCRVVSPPSRRANGFKDTKITRHETVDGDHGPHRDQKPIR